MEKKAASRQLYLRSGFGQVLGTAHEPDPTGTEEMFWKKGECVLRIGEAGDFRD
jgi:hypothetical protein